MHGPVVTGVDLSSSHKVEPMETLTRLQELVNAAERIVVFTGAGISTESGIPDFRSADGVWTKYDPRDFTFDKYVASAEIREMSWRMRGDFFGLNPQPNAGHRAIAAWEATGRMSGVITQNIDGLHQDAGSTNVVEIHGTARDVMCIGLAPTMGTPDGCGFRQGHEWAMRLVNAGDPDPMCPVCGGIVKSAVVSFGQTMFPADIMRATTLAKNADLFICVGSSLQVYPAADLPIQAAENGAAVVIINNEPTPLDSIATLVVRGSAGEILGSLQVPDKTSH